MVVFGSNCIHTRVGVEPRRNGQEEFYAEMVLWGGLLWSTYDTLGGILEACDSLSSFVCVLLDCYFVSIGN